jgi:hypothetical protein
MHYLAVRGSARLHSRNTSVGGLNRVEPRRAAAELAVDAVTGLA